MPADLSGVHIRKTAILLRCLCGASLGRALGATVLIKNNMAETEKADGISLAPEYRALQDAFEQLQKKISPGGIVGALYSRNLLLLNEVDTIRSKPVILEKNEELLLAMCKRSPAQVLQFCQFLLGDQCHCGNILKEGRPRC